MKDSRFKPSDNHELSIWSRNFALGIEYLHWKKLISLVGLEKANQICLDVWGELTVSSWRQAKKRLKIKGLKTFEDFKKVVKESIPKSIAWEIHQEDSDRFEIRYTDCPWHTFLQNKIRSSDRPSYREWLIEAQRRNCQVRIEESGLKNISGKTTKFMCTGDQYCDLVYQKITNQGDRDHAGRNRNTQST